MNERVALVHLFHVRIDFTDVGLWTEFSGLSAKYDIESYKEGGNNWFTHKFPGRLEFENIKLKRPLTSESGKLYGWFASLQGQSAVRTTASITAYDSDLQAVATYNFIDVIPVSWTGPKFDSNKTEIAMEELEFAHHGFLQVG